MHSVPATQNGQRKTELNTVERRLSELNHPKRQIPEPTFSSLKFLVHSFFKKNYIIQ